jgi:hypothetical protein
MMLKIAWLGLFTLPLGVLGGFLYAKVVHQADKPQRISAAGYICPITGEELPCPNCCPLNQKR